ncbi:Staphylococcal nuclease homologue [Metamycoplasma arthritidis]|uniref:Nuclease, lipoprotein n=1 Tax=Metamycoplasma arthritidis (strain 158L3-1) TaxID=243272 RepID=B3PNI6_META1|nr:thermonuclease family protein [Metamycoplasma arthritidis]ACF07588.1 nuclease, lipoprotein [Metamycoplasma arthritidis 158L3-1]VEU79096.1 Staphylococcal nuclease homologue [Metamycoplasma arthritidis]
MKINKILKLSPFAIATILAAPIALTSCINPKQEKNLTHEYGKEAEFTKKYPFSKELEANKATKININQIIDGDTIVDSDNNKYRLAGINAPETWDNQNKRPTAGKQALYGNLAKKYAAKLIEDQNIKEIFVVPQKTKKGTSNISDKFGRIVAIVYYKTPSNEYYNFNAQMVRYGLVRKQYISLSKSSIYYTKNVEYFNLLQESEELAKKEGLGIWKPSDENGVVGDQITKIYPR